jgi:hypothetical protein
MDWYKISFPEDVFPFDEPGTLEKEVQEIFAKAGCPKGFVVLQEIQQNASLVFYFSPAAQSYCADLFKSYRGSSCDLPVGSAVG